MAMALREDCDSAACLTHVLARSLDDKCFQAMVDGDIDGHMPGHAGASRRDGAPVRASDRRARHTTADLRGFERRSIHCRLLLYHPVASRK